MGRRDASDDILGVRIPHPEKSDEYPFLLYFQFSKNAIDAIRHALLFGDLLSNSPSAVLVERNDPITQLPQYGPKRCRDVGHVIFE